MGVHHLPSDFHVAPGQMPWSRWTHYMDKTRASSNSTNSSAQRHHCHVCSWWFQGNHPSHLVPRASTQPLPRLLLVIVCQLLVSVPVGLPQPAATPGSMEMTCPLPDADRPARSLSRSLSLYFLLSVGRFLMVDILFPRWVCLTTHG